MRGSLPHWNSMWATSNYQQISQQFLNDNHPFKISSKYTSQNQTNYQHLPCLQFDIRVTLHIVSHCMFLAGLLKINLASVFLTAYVL